MLAVEDIVRRVRALAQDADGPGYRYSDRDVLDAIADGVERVREQRPEVLHGTPARRLESTAEHLEIPLSYAHPVALYATGALMLREDEYAQDGRSAALLDRARAMLRGRA